MGEALVGGLLGAGWMTTDEVSIVEKVHPRCEELRALFPGAEVVGSVASVRGSLADVVVAVKPQDVAGACEELNEAGVERVLSIAAGVSTATMESALGGSVPVVRAMPNTPALVGMGASAIAPGALASRSEMEWARSILESVGVVVEVTEDELDAVTGLSGSGPAYVFLVAESLVDAGVLVGLSRATAEVLAVQTLVGAATMLRDTDETAADLRAGVMSPGGTTVSGLRELENAGVRAAFFAAVDAATRRARELRAE